MSLSSKKEPSCASYPGIMDSPAAIAVLEQCRLPDMSDAELQRLVDVAMRLYAERLSEDVTEALPRTTALAATDVMVATTALLESVNIQLFELGMWQTFSGVRSRP